MEKLLIICEKPSAMRNFAAALGGRQGTFEGDTYAICNLYGHIMELGTPAQVAKKDYKSIVGDFKDVAGIPWNPEYFDFYSKALKSGSGDFDGYKQSYSTIQTFLNAGYIPVSRAILMFGVRVTCWFKRSWIVLIILVNVIANTMYQKCLKMLSRL